jgi:ketosteroid isomerase-like protein
VATLLERRHRVTEVELRLRSLEAKAEIRALPIGYATAYARLDIDALVSLYTHDVELLDGRHGRAALHAHFGGGVRGAPGGGLDSVILHTGDHTIDVVTHDEARGTVYCHVEVLLRDGTGYYQAVVYTDRYRREGNQWYFARQRTHELVCGAPLSSRPDHATEAHWPASQVGRGTLPYRLPSWRRFWAEPVR